MMLEWLFGNPETNHFNALKGRVGFGLAVVMMLEELSYSFFSGLLDEKWYTIIFSCDSYEQRVKVAEKLSKQQKTFYQWQSLYKNGTHSHCDYSEEWSRFIEDVAIEKMVELADTFDQWKQIYERTRYNVHSHDKIKDKALEMMKKYR